MFITLRQSIEAAERTTGIKMRWLDAHTVLLPNGQRVKVVDTPEEVTHGVLPEELWHIISPKAHVPGARPETCLICGATGFADPPVLGQPVCRACFDAGKTEEYA